MPSESLLAGRLRSAVRRCSLIGLVFVLAASLAPLAAGQTVSNRRGVLTLSGGVRYEGELHDGVPEGQGLLTFPDGRRYTGAFRGGQANGPGTLTFPDGKRFEGEFRDGRLDGHGVFVGADGRRYEGAFRDARATGRGVLVFPDGGRYEGEFRDDKFHGHGVRTLPDGARYEGEFHDGRLDGHGVFVGADGRRYEGELRDFRANGRGVLVFPDGGRYEGEFRDDKLHGHGVRTWPGGRRYEGEFRDGQAERPAALDEKILFTLATRFAYGLSFVAAAAMMVIFVALPLKLAGLVSRRLRTRFDRALNGILLGSGGIFAAVWLLSPFGLMHALPFLAVSGLVLASMWVAPRVIPAETEPEPDHGAEPHGVWAQIRERFIHFRSLEPPLRLLTALATAQLIASALLLVFYGPGSARLPLDAEGSVYMAPSIFRLAIAFFVMAWAVVLVGVSPGRRSFLLVLALFTITTLPWPLAPGIAATVWAVMAGAVWSWAVVTWRYRRRLREAGGLAVPWSHTLASVLFLIAVLGSAYGILGLRLPLEGAGAFPALVTEHLFRFSLCLVPILFLTGKDCAEIAELVAHLAVVPIAGRRVRGVVSLLAVLVPVAILSSAIATSRDTSSYQRLVTYFAPTGLALVGLVPLVVLAGLAYAFRRCRRRPARIVLGGLIGLVGVLALVAAFVMMVAFGEYSVAVAVLGLGSIGVLWILLRRAGVWQWRSAEVPFAALLLVAVFLAGMHEIATLWQAAYSEPPARGADTRFGVIQCTEPFAKARGLDLPDCSLAYPNSWQRAVVPRYRTLVIREGGAGLREADFRFPDAEMKVPAFLLTVREIPAGGRGTEEIDLLGAATRAWPFLDRGGVYTNWNATAGSGRKAWAGRESIAYAGGKRQHVWIWVRRIDRHVWMLAGYGPEQFSGHYGRLYGDMVASWRPDRGAQEPPAVTYVELKTTALRIASFGVLPAVLAPIGFALLLLPRIAGSSSRSSSRLRRLLAGHAAAEPRSFGGPRDVAGCFIVVLALTAFVFFPHGELTELFGHAEAPAGTDHVSEALWAPSGQGIKTLQIVVAATTLTVALVLALRRRMTANTRLVIELLRLNVALVVLALLFWVFSGLAWASETSVWLQAGVFISLKLYDFLMSGKDVTNRTGRVFQRRDLVLVYLGYLMLVSTAILYVSAQRLPNGHPPERFFDAELLLSQGIVWLGAPLLLFGFLFRIRRWLRGLLPHALTA